MQVRDLYAKQRGQCAACRRKVSLAKMTRDHIIPLAHGGDNWITNIQLLCAPCNNSKGAKHPVDFMQLRGYLL